MKKNLEIKFNQGRFISGNQILYKSLMENKHKTDAEMILLISEFFNQIFQYKKDNSENNVWEVISVFLPPVAEITKVKEFFKLKSSFTENDIILNVAAMKLLIDTNGVLNSKKWNILYSQYKKNFGIQRNGILTKNEFKKVFQYVNLYCFDPSWAIKDPLMKVSKNVNGILEILNVYLRDFKADQLKLISKIYSHESIISILQSYEKNRFSKLDEEEIRKQINRIQKLLLKENPLDILCGIDLGQISPSNHHLYRTNNIAVENNFLYNLFQNKTKSKINSSRNNIVIGASPFFIKKWISSRAVDELPTTFVVHDDYINLLNLHFNNPNYSGKITNRVRGISLSEFISNIQAEILSANVLVIDNPMINNHMAAIESVSLKDSGCSSYFEYTGDSRMIEVIGSNLLNKKNMRGYLMPKGLLENTRPKYKILWTAEDGESYNKDIEFARVVKINEKNDYDKVMIDYIHTFTASRSMLANGSSLRAVLYSSNSNKSGNARKKTNSLQFSPEIDINYVLSDNGKNNYPRIEAYYKAKNNNFETNNNGRKSIVKNTKKCITTVPYEDVEKWVQTVYPFLIIRTRDGETISIRDRIGAVFNDYKMLSDSDAYQLMSFRTFWYTNPKLEERFSMKSKALLKKIAMSSIGELYIQNTTVQEYSDEIEKSLLKKSKIKELLAIISIALDYALKMGYITMNPFDEISVEEVSYEKNFATIRRNLTKKTFTSIEFSKAVEYLGGKIEEGQIEYIALLIKLCMGLESNIVCALRWRDIIYNDSLRFHQLLIYEQISSDGKTCSGFTKEETYRVLPVPSMLSYYFKVGREELGRHKTVEEDSLIFTINPHTLGKLSKELMVFLNIEPQIIWVPASDSSLIETDIGKFYGDIFQTNVKYWCLWAGYTVDEISYFCGNQAATTVGRHYLDFKNDYIQYRIFRKLDRIFKLILPRMYDLDSEGLKNSGDYINVKSSGFYPSLRKYILEIDSEKMTELSIISEFGCSYNIEKV